MQNVCDANVALWRDEDIKECGKPAVIRYKQARLSDGTEVNSDRWGYRCGEHEKWLSTKYVRIERLPVGG